MSKLALDLIEKCIKTKDKYLDLGRCGLKSKDFVKGSELDLALRRCGDHLETLIFSDEWHDWENNLIKSSNNTESNNFFETDPPALLELTSLTTLIMCGSYSHPWRITEIGFLSSTSKLKSVNLRYNKFSDKTAIELSKITNISKLDLSDNQISDRGANAIGNMANLIYLDISSNRLTDNGIIYISRLVKLKQLFIHNYELKKKALEAIVNLEGLTILGLNNNHLADEEAQELGKIVSLTKLYIRYNQLTERGAKEISKLKNLTYLDIRDNKLTNKGSYFIALLIKLTYLDISHNQILDEGAESLSNLKKLKYLDISENEITDKGAEAISKIKNLNILHIKSNLLTIIGAKSISNLSNLISLNVSNCHIEDKGVEFISNLSKLEYLYVGNNQLTDIGAKFIGSLSNLVELDISHNLLTAKGAQAISSLKKLEFLNISYNTLGDKGSEAISKLSNLVYLYISSNQLTDKSSDFIIKLTALNFLFIRANSLKKLRTIQLFVHNLKKLTTLSFDYEEVEGFPSEISSDVTALRAYFRSTEKVSNTLVKLILIGNTTAGKSSLADYLSNKNYESGRESTHGIKLWRWKTGEGKEALQVNIWDFGGQDYYHTTHNLFLDDKAIFLLLQASKDQHLAGAENNQYFSESYWLGNIRSFTNEESSIWYIHSKSEDISQHFLDSELQRKYRVNNQYKISIKQVSEGVNSSIIEFNYFLDNLINELRLFAKSELPASWVQIRDKFLPDWRNKDVFLSKAEFRDKCESALKSDHILFQDLVATWEGLMPYLKGCGEIIYFINESTLGDFVFLSAEGLTNGIYNVLSQKVLTNKGEFTLDDLKENDRQHAEMYLEVLLAFKIVFEKRGSTGVYVAPQYLPKNPYTIHFQKLIKIAYVIRFPYYMSKSIITKFLVEYAGREVDNFYWRHGAFFEKYGVKSFVRIDTDLQRIYVHVEDINNKSKFEIMRELFLFFTIKEKWGANYLETDSKLSFNYKVNIDKKIVTSLKSLVEDVPGEIELSINDNDFVSVADLREAMKFKAFKIKSKQGEYVEFNAILHQILNTNSIIPKKIFLSYSHKDDELKKELDTHFAALKRSGKVETWQDRKILPGEDWDKSIEEALLNSDIALLLLSPDFMASDYIWNVELPKAIKHGITIIPIFLRPCDFNESIFEIYKTQGLPGDTDWIVSNKYTYRDEAYLKVINGIKELIEK